MAQDDGIRVTKAKTAKGKRALEKRAPKEVRCCAPAGLHCTRPMPMSCLAVLMPRTIAGS